MDFLRQEQVYIGFFADDSPFPFSAPTTSFPVAWTMHGRARTADLPEGLFSPEKPDHPWFMME
ncbi:hypothetical protein [Lihuaxuella thermophila]|uniref:hypothetical protein n=1 Tax=Lihuaxuella thermophila TaxID=1173111 RepID=UPI000B7DA798|nr:hypothetical protein [Lihuaxuella thermophila]